MKKNIAIVMGGYSSEVEISLKSGNVVFDELDHSFYQIYKVLILKDKWVWLDKDENEHPVDRADFSLINGKERITIDCVFNAIHGHPGENGVLLAYFELLKMPHTSSPFYQMAVTFNKRDTLSFLKPYGIRMANSVYLNKGDIYWQDQILRTLGLPCFVKPNKSGSSFGVTKVKHEDDLEAAIQFAFKEDDEILIESFLDGIEVSVGVIEWKGEIKVLPITEIVSQNEFFDFEAKYLGKSDEITPARLSLLQQKNIERVSHKIYKTLNLKGLSRADFIIVEDTPYFIELNMVPGLTRESILPKQAKEANISLTELFGNCIEMALKN
ncbi:D-alanine--D-alanine ligase [Namhaeicola litoreus]|uniref:D-alanine--D-alanine ligase n=1 Tax=Namhaeicola litoreus TaxID=1052145 RepID=A0ABW3Y631_9FLAO